MDIEDKVLVYAASYECYQRKNVLSIDGLDIPVISKEDREEYQMVIEKAQFFDLEDILSLQKLAFQSEAKLFNDYSITPLTQSIESMKEDFKNNLYLKAVSDGNILGSIRAYDKENVCYIGRLFVHPNHQNKGIGKSLMLHIEELFNHCKMYSLFVAKRVSKNLHFYGKLGYGIAKEEKVDEDSTFVYFFKNNN